MGEGSEYIVVTWDVDTLSQVGIEDKTHLQEGFETAIAGMVYLDRDVHTCTLSGTSFCGAYRSLSSPWDERHKVDLGLRVIDASGESVRRHLTIMYDSENLQKSRLWEDRNTGGFRVC